MSMSSATRRSIGIFLVLMLMLVPSAVLAQPHGGGASGNPAMLAKMHEINDQLQAMGLGIAIQEIEYFTIGEGRPSDRILQQEFRWVSGDPRRDADGSNLTYHVNQTFGATTSGLTAAQTEAAIDRSMNTWDSQSCLSTVDLVKRPEPAVDSTIFDSFFGFGVPGDPFLSDIVSAGWYPRDFFEAVGGPGGGDGILAFSVTFIFTNPDGSPSDINNDQHLDTALNEVYYNDTFGDPAGNREGNPWAIDEALPAIDVETVALHENGHSLGVGHFGPPPGAVMNPVYSGPQQQPSAVDNAGMCTVFARWK